MKRKRVRRDASPRLIHYASRVLIALCSVPTSRMSPSRIKARLAARKQGFTLIELLLVIGIIAILAAVVIVAINPTKQLGDARNAQRKSHVKTILDAVYQYALDNNGNVPTGITTTSKFICKSGPNVDCDADGVRLNILTGSYVVAIPSDPQSATATGTNYKIQSLQNGRITVTAPGAEQSATISVTR